jgi:hypothetical protein
MAMAGRPKNPFLCLEKKGSVLHFNKMKAHFRQTATEQEG